MITLERDRFFLFENEITVDRSIKLKGFIVDERIISIKNSFSFSIKVIHTMNVFKIQSFDLDVAKRFN